jgi:hypothetical protein
MGSKQQTFQGTEEETKAFLHHVQATRWWDLMLLVGAIWYSFGSGYLPASDSLAWMVTETPRYALLLSVEQNTQIVRMHV